MAKKSNKGLAMTTVTITLPEDLVERAKAKGLLSSAAIEAYVREKLEKADIKGGFDPCLEGLVNPAAYRKGEILGDIIGPFHEEWGDVD